MNDNIQPTEQSQPAQQGGAAPSGGPMCSLAITGFIVSFFCGIVGIILSLKARRQINESGGKLKGWGFTTGGIIVSIVNIAVAVLNVIITVAAQM